jgi:hypothetical protein
MEVGKMRTLVILLALVCLIGTAVAVDPSKILIKRDTDSGNYIETAITALWPSCTQEVFLDAAGIPGFVAALGTGTYDLVVWDGFMQRSLNTTDYDAMATWYTAHKGFAFDDWGIRVGTPASMLTAMGCSYAGSYYTSLPAHYCWLTGDPYATGITGWTLATHGVSKGTWGMDMTASSATPVTGWTATATAGKAALMRAGNGVGCVSGMFWYTMDTQYVDLMKNILTDMWNGCRPDVKVAATSLGSIKAGYR